MLLLDHMPLLLRRRVLLELQLASLRHDEIVVFCEVQNEIKGHRLDIAQTRIENHALESPIMVGRTYSEYCR